MSSVAIDIHVGLAARLYQAYIGKKFVMALTGVILFGYLVGHLLGNLQAFLGPERMDAYAAFLHSMPNVLVLVRALRLVSVVADIRGSGRPTAWIRAAGPTGSM